MPGTSTPVREIHLITTTTYDAAETRIEGDLALSDASDIALGHLMVFKVPVTLPNSVARAEIRIGGETANRAIRDYQQRMVTIGEMTPGRFYWSIVSATGLVVLNPVGEPDITRRYQRTITNAELKNLDTDYVELVPAPGADKFLSVQLASITKTGSDVPPTQNARWYGVAISTDTVLTEAEVAAGNSQTYAFLNVPTWPAGQQRYVFVGVPDDRRDITGINVPTTEEPEDFFARVFERVPGTVNNADGVPIKWWRTMVAYDTPEDVFGGQSYTSGWSNDENTAILENIIRYAYTGLMQVIDTASDKPLHNGAEEFTWITGHLSNVLLSADADHRFLSSVGGHDLNENTALVYGVMINRLRSGRDGSYSAAAFDGFMEPVDDVALEISVNYQVLEV